MQTCEDLFNDPQFKHRDHYVFLDHKEIGRHAYDGVEFKLSSCDPTYRPSPLLGEHTEWVCKEILGWDDARIKEMAESGLLS